MKKVRIWWGCNRDYGTDILEFDDDATEQEIEEEVRDYVMSMFEWGYSVE